MKSPAQITARIMAKLATRVLPVGTPVVASTGMGTGAICAGCDKPIRAVEVECACVYAEAPALRFHIDCFTEWRRQQTV